MNTPRTTPTEVPERTRCLSGLARGEWQAAETVRTLLEPMRPSALRSSLEVLWRNHREAASMLAERLGEGSDVDAPYFGGFHWSLLSSEPPHRRNLEQLHEAETAWVRAYERALLGGALAPADGALLLSILLPRQRAHPPLLERALTSA